MQSQLINELKNQNGLQKEAFDKILDQFQNIVKNELEKSSNGCADRCISEIVCKLAHTQDIHFPPLGHTSGVETAGLAAQSVNNNIVCDDNRMHCEMPTQPTKTIDLLPVVQPPFSQQPPVVHRQQSGTSAWKGNFQSQHLNNLYNRPPSFRSNCASSTAAELGDNGGDFQKYYSRQHRRQTIKRQRQHAEEILPNEQQPRLKVVGKALSTGMRAHGNIVDKRVFSVSNVDTSYTEENIDGFLQENGINVFTVHNAKTKFDGKCFRVCIAAADTERFMNADIWPENVLVRPWFFKEKHDD